MDDEPEVEQLENRIEKLESTIEKMMPSRRDALKMGGAALVGGSLMAGAASADTVDDQVGTIGGPNEEVDLVSEDIDNSNQITTQDLVVNGTATGPFGSDLQGCRVFLSSDQSASGETKIAFDSVVYDSDNNFDTTTGEWTCPETGIYFANVHVLFTGGGSAQERRVMVGDEVTDTPSGEGSFVTNADSDRNANFEATTMNKYTQGDVIAGYVENKDSSDTLSSGDKNLFTFMEVVFLGSL